MNNEYTKGLRTIERLMRAARVSIGPTVPAQLVQTFVTVALNEGKSGRELGDLVGATESTISRHLLDLGERNRRMEVGYQLVDSKADPMFLRRKSYSLTPRGKLVAQQLVETLNNNGG